MTDFALELNDIGRPEVTLNPADKLLNAVLLSLHIERGAWFFDPDFGFPRDKIKTTSAADIALARQYALECLKWIITAKMAKSIDVWVTSPQRGVLNFRIVLDGTTTYETTLSDWDKPTPPPSSRMVIDEIGDALIEYDESGFRMEDVDE